MNLRSFVLFIAVVSGVIGIVSAQTAPAHKTVAKKTTTTKAVTKKAPAKPAVRTASKKAPATSGAKKKAPVRRVASQPRQSAPTSDRYKEIQGALVAKGYLKSEPNGVWDAQSIDAMKRYQC